MVGHNDMSKFDFDYMRNDELEVMCYNKNKRKG